MCPVRDPRRSAAQCRENRLIGLIFRTIQPPGCENGVVKSRVRGYVVGYDYSRRSIWFQPLSRHPPLPMNPPSTTPTPPRTFLKGLFLVLGLLFATGAAWSSEITVDMLDVGQGDALVIRTDKGKSVLIDAGEGGTPVLPLLQGLGIHKLDLVVSTHPHADHIGGMLPVVENMPVKLYIDNGEPHTTAMYRTLKAAVSEHHIPYKTAQKGQIYKLAKDATLTVLFPGPMPLSGTRSDLNANSVVLRLDHDHSCMLFMGDAEAPTEEQVVADGLKTCEVLKVPHHGGNHSTTEALLAAAQPKVALISVGTGNRYGHPGPETLDRLQRWHVAVYRTDLSGNLRVLLEDHSVEVLEGVEIPVPLPMTFAPSAKVPSSNNKNAH
jgi:competence protein ComEC